MRFIPELFEKVESARLFGTDAPNGRVTVAPYWTLKTTPPAYGNSVRGPYRYYRNGLEEEFEIPSIKSISWNRSKGQDLATCTVTLYNAWHELNTQDPEQIARLGKPGYFWPKRGTGDSAATWNQEPGRGAYEKDGTWNASFSWSNVLVEDALIFTYEGYGGHSTDGDYVSIDTNLENHNLLITGVWMVDTISTGSDGMMTLSCRDVGRLLLDQPVFPPLIPAGLYPLEYTVAGKSPFESPWGPKVKTGVSPASRGEVRITPRNWTGTGDSSISSAYPLINAVDGDPKTFTLSEAYASSTGYDPPYPATVPPKHAVFFDFDVNDEISAVSLTTWAGGYEAYISISVDGDFIGSQNIPVASPRNAPYVQKINVPQNAPDGTELPSIVNLGNGPDEVFNVETLRITLVDLYYSQIGNSSGNHYRGGLRDVTAYRVGAKTDQYNPNHSELPWTLSMAAHPTRGYWIAEQDGSIHGFGDAADYDSTLYGPVPIGGLGYENRIASVAAHPSGKGYWAMDWMGHVWAYGAAVKYGADVPVPDPWVGLNDVGKVQARDLAPTHTGNGYWVLYTNGIIRGFGDAAPSYTVIPQTPVATYMDAFLRNNYDPGRYIPYDIGQKATAITAHPHKMGFWVTDGSGQVFAYGAAQHKGQLHNRVYKQGYADTFTMERFEWVTAIECTDTGEGYWILFPTGKIAMFGDAINKGPVAVPQDVFYDLEENKVPALIGMDAFADLSAFREITWSIVRDPDGSGFWVLKTSGEVVNYDAEHWGNPGYQGLTGYRWHEGNWSGNWSDIVNDLLMWSGFLLKNGNTNLTSGQKPEVFGRIESTGIKTDTNIPGDRFDKKTIIDCIKEIAEVVAYDFKINENGSVEFSSSNWWRAGNFDEDGLNIYVAGDSYNRVDEDDELANPFIPEIHEDLNLFDYAATLSSSDNKSEYIIGTDAPSPKDPSRTGYVRFTPPVAREQLFSGVPTMRGMVRPAIWVSNLFENQEEAQIMAELIALHAWFSRRTGSTSCVANPALSLGDQIRIIEQNSSETFIHLITAIDSNLDLDSGAYTMNISSHWLGDADNWVITTGTQPLDRRYVRISERLDSWQARTQRKLGTGSAGQGNLNRTTITGEFDASIAPANDDATWGIRSLGVNQLGSGDSTNFLNLMMYGNGHLWPFDETGSNVWEDGGLTFNSTVTLAQEQNKDLILTVGLAPPLFSDLDDPTAYLARAVQLINTYQIRRVIIWQDLEDLTMSEYITFFNTAYTTIKAGADISVSIYGPNVLLDDIGDVSLIEDFIDDANFFDGIALAGDFSDSDWADIIDEVKSITTSPLMVSLKNGTSGQPNELHQALDLTDIALWPSDETFSSPYNPADNPNWVFEGTITTTGILPALRVTTDRLSAPLGTNNFIEIYQGGSLIINEALGGINETVNLGNIGAADVSQTFTFRVVGIPTAAGNGRLKLNFNANTIQEISVEDTIMIVR